jgi:hypothetical protein
LRRIRLKILQSRPFITASRCRVTETFSKMNCSALDSVMKSLMDNSRASADDSTRANYSDPPVPSINLAARPVNHSKFVNCRLKRSASSAVGLIWTVTNMK